jgi:hypothetical protein
MSISSSALSTLCVFAPQVEPDGVAAGTLTSRPVSVVASEATGDGPEYRYGGARTFRTSFSLVGRARNANSDEYALEKPPTKTTLS